MQLSGTVLRILIDLLLLPNSNLFCCYILHDEISNIQGPKCVNVDKLGSLMEVFKNEKLSFICPIFIRIVIFTVHNEVATR